MAADLAQQIRDRLDGLGPVPALEMGFPEPWTPGQREQWAEAFKAEMAKSRSEPIRILPPGLKVYPGFEQMRAAILAVVEYAEPGEQFPRDSRDHAEKAIDAEVEAQLAHVLGLIAEKLGIEASGV